MGWFALLLYLAATVDQGPYRPTPASDPFMALCAGIGVGIAMAVMLAPFAYQAGQRLGDRAGEWWMSRTGDATGQGGERGA